MGFIRPTKSGFDLSRRYRTKAETILAFSRAARAELQEWGSTPQFQPASTLFSTQFSVFCFWLTRLLGFGTWWLTGPGYWRAWARLGGEARIANMIIIARFDADNSGSIDDQEISDYHKFGEALVANHVNTFQNFAVVFTLLIGAAHQTVVGRPAPWSAPAPFVDRFGQDATP
jgi:hypothetical protein